MIRSTNKWIQNAVKRPGSLRRYVWKKYGMEGFTKDGNIKIDILRELEKSKNDLIARRANLALTLKDMRHKRKTKKR